MEDNDTTNFTTNETITSMSYQCGDPIFTGILIILIGLFSALGNCLVIGSSYLDPEIRKGGLLPMVTLAFSDLLFAELSCSIMLTNLIHGDGDHLDPVLCTIFGVAQLMLVNVMMYQHAFLAFSRYLAICHPIRYRVWFTTPNAMWGLVGIYAGCFFATLIPSLTPSPSWPFVRYLYDNSLLTCLYQTSPMNQIYASLLFFVAPVGVSTFCYVSCMTTLRKRALGKPTDSTTARQKRLAMTLFITYSIVLFNSSPFPWMVLIYANRPECSLLKRHLCWLILVNCCCNPVVYAIKSSKFRRMFARQLGIKLPDNNVSHAESTIQA